MAGPFADVRVLDLTEHIAGPYATKLFADFGADVIKVERPGGDPARKLGPFRGEPGPETSGTFFYFNTNKRSVVLDLKTAEGRAAFLRLVDRADVVVDSARPGVLDRLGVGWDVIHARKPSVPLVSITNFGQESPYKDYKGTDLVMWAFAGEMYSTGRLDREPVKMYGTAALVQSGSAAATAILGALFVGRYQGIGQHVDFSIADSHFVGVDRRHATVMGYQFSGRKTLRSPGAGVRLLGGVYPCADGWVDLDGGGTRFKRGAREFLGHPEWLEDPKWDDPAIGMNPEAVEEFNAHFYVWLMEHTKREVWEAARRAKIICGPLFTVDEVFDDPNFRARGFWQHAETPELGSFEFPGRPFLMSETPWEYRRSAPRLGEHTAEVLREAGLNEAEIAALEARAREGVA
jgi:crotonobetainyl-CoA:carnitine CoA-transferase CaiB-like acyl-CoA transferase